MAFSIADLFGGSLTKGVGEIISKFKVDPTVKAQLEAAVQENAHELALKEAELNAKLLDLQGRELDIAGQNIRAETQSEDNYTKRARPTFLYIMELILVWNYIAVPLLGKVPIEFPEALFWMFGSCMLGYTGARTWEKFAGAPKAKQ
jgi:hypothetical protein